MQLSKRKGRWILYDDNGYIVVITTNKNIALSIMKSRG